METLNLVGTVVSDQDSPTFETVRIKLKADQEIRPGSLLKIPLNGPTSIDCLIARVRSAVEKNPNETPEDINVRDTLGIPANYPKEKDSTIIYRLVEADLIEEITSLGMRAPETLPKAGTDVYLASGDDVVAALGTITSKPNGLFIGEASGGTDTPIVLKRETVQRHMFVCGTTGSGKSYAMGVIVEELVKLNLPVVFLDL